MNQNIECTKAAMKTMSQTLGLPEYYRTDLTMDFETLGKSPGGKWLWLLRTCGTVLVPLYSGVHPVNVKYWLDSNHDQTVVCFLVDCEQKLVSQITSAEADKLVDLPPRVLTAGMSVQELRDSVQSVLEHGCANGLWGIFESPSSIESIGSWQDWLSYFRSMNNDVMSDFMAKAVRIAANKQMLHSSLAHS